MSILAQNMYPTDLTMTLASNYIQNETKAFATVEDRIFVPDGGPFFSQSLLIKDNNGVLLRPNVDFKLLHLNEEASIESGRDVVAVIWILKETIPSVTLDYRVVGGIYGNTVGAILSELKSNNGSAGNVDWNGNVFGKPDQYPPAPHYHTPDAFTEWSMVYTQLDGIRKGIITGDDASWESHYNYINRKTAAIESNIQSNLANYATREYVASLTLGGSGGTVDLSGYYDKLTIDNKLTSVTNTINELTSQLTSNYLTKIAADERYPVKSDSYTKQASDLRYALKDDVYNKVESDNKYATITKLNEYATINALNQLDASITNRIASAVSGGTIDLSGYYDKTQTYGKTEVYSKLETYSRDQTYSRTEVDNKLASITNALTSLTESVNTYMPRYRIVNAATNYTLVQADLKGNTIVRCTSVAANTVTLPAVNENMIIGSVISIRQVGVGVVTIAGAAGVTVSPSDSLVLRRTGSTATLVYVGSNTFDLISELA